jgi:fatty acid desaturase
MNDTLRYFLRTFKGEFSDPMFWFCFIIFALPTVPAIITGVGIIPTLLVFVLIMIVWPCAKTQRWLMMDSEEKDR